MLHTNLLLGDPLHPRHSSAETGAMVSHCKCAPLASIDPRAHVAPINRCRQRTLCAVFSGSSGPLWQW